MELHRVPHAGPADPMPAATVALRPLGTATSASTPTGCSAAGRSAMRRRPCRTASTRWSVSGANDNMRRVVGQSDADFAGMWFADSDVYKTLEAAAGRRPGGPTARSASTSASWPRCWRRRRTPTATSNSYFQVDHRDQQWQELGWSHEMYCAGHLIQAAVAARAGRDRRPQLLAVARRFADLLVTRFGPDGDRRRLRAPARSRRRWSSCTASPGTGRTSTWPRGSSTCAGTGCSGERRFGPRYFQDHGPVREAPEVTGHAVRQLYLLAGAVDVAVETRRRRAAGRRPSGCGTRRCHSRPT